MNKLSFNSARYLTATGLTTTVTFLAGMTAQPSIAAQFFDITAITTGSLTDGTDQTINGINYLSQTLPIAGITADGVDYSLNTLPTPQLTLRRSGAGTSPNRQIVWSERPSSGTQTTVRISPPTSTEQVLQGNNLFTGTDNLFVNSNQNAGNQSDVERVDFIVSRGFTVNPSQGAVILERGSTGRHDDFQIAAITGLDSNGIPNQFGELQRVSNWGQTNLRVGSQTPPPNPSPNPTYTVLNNTGSGGAFSNTSNITGQNIGGALVPLSELAPINSQIFGWALFGSDVLPDTNGNAVADWRNSMFYPPESPEGGTQGGNGIDLLAANVGVVAKENLFPLFEVEGRAGVMGFEDYEFAIGEVGADNPLLPGDLIYRDWVDEEEVSWSLTWNPTTKIATFTVDGQTMDYISPLNINDPIFNLYTLTVYSKLAQGKVDAGTMIELTVNMINGASIDPVVVSAMAGSAELNTFNSGLVEGITSMSGSIVMDWPDNGLNPNAAKARSRVGFDLKGFDPLVTSSTEQVPEPGTFLALLTVGGLGLTTKLKKSA